MNNKYNKNNLHSSYKNAISSYDQKEQDKSVNYSLMTLAYLISKEVKNSKNKADYALYMNFLNGVDKIISKSVKTV